MSSAVRAAAARRRSAAAGLPSSHSKQSAEVGEQFEDLTAAFNRFVDAEDAIRVFVEKSRTGSLICSSVQRCTGRALMGWFTAGGWCPLVARLSVMPSASLWVVLCGAGESKNCSLLGGAGRRVMVMAVYILATENILLRSAVRWAALERADGGVRMYVRACGAPSAVVHRCCVHVVCACWTSSSAALGSVNS